MSNLTIDMDTILKQEEEVVLSHFTAEEALKLGLKILELAGENSKKIVVSIKRNGQQLFYVAGSETIIDNEYWIKKKRNVVERHSHSSLYVRHSYNDDENEYYNHNAVEPSEFAIHGGGFPILVKDTGMVGSVICSGLVSEEDHMLCVNALRAIKAEQK